MVSRVKNVLITGATRGLGLSYARFIAKQGYNVGLTDISENACKVYGELDSVGTLIDELRSYGIKTDFMPADLTDSKQVDYLLENFVKKFNTIYGVVTNAGGDVSGNDQDASGGKPENNSIFISQIEANNIFTRNFNTCLNTIKSTIPYMIDEKFGKIVTVSSINAAMGVERETIYSVAKASVLQLTRSLATELRKFGINVNCIMPGPVRTARFLATLKGRNPHDLEALEAKSRLERVASTEDISSVVEFLLSPASDFISGEVIKVDGGLFNHSI